MDRSVRAKVLLAEARELGLSLEDLTHAAGAGGGDGRGRGGRRVVPTVSAYVAEVEPMFTKGTRRTYGTYWRLAVALFGDKRLDAVGVADCETVLAKATRRAMRARPDVEPRAPQENCIAALRALFRRAERARLVPDNPAMALEKPRRLPNRRRGLTEVELAEVIDTVHTTSRDVGLDLLVVRFHLESGARQEGALGLSLGAMDARRSTVWLREKFGKEREQPISPSLFAELRRHAIARGATGEEDKVFRNSRWVPITRRRYDTLFGKVQAALEWTERAPVTAHVLRHTTATVIERLAGQAVAEAFLGHTPASVTNIYTKGRIGEVAAVVAALTGEPHPLAEPGRA